MENEEKKNDAKTLEELKVLAQTEIDKFRRQRQTLIGNLKIVGSDVPPANTNIHHLEMIKEKLNKPENQELLKDEDKTYFDRTIDIPNKRRQIFNDLALKIKKPTNIYIYYASYKMNYVENASIEQYFKPKLTTSFDFFDNNYVIGKLFINLENPSITYFINKNNYASFKSSANIFLINNYSGNTEQIMQLRDIYMTDYLEHGLDYAVSELTYYGGFLTNGSSRNKR